MAAPVFNAVLTGDWKRLGWTLATAAARFPTVMRNSLRDEGTFYAQKIREGIDSQAPNGQTFKKLSSITLALRKMRGGKGTKILLETNAMRNAVRMVPVGDHAVFVGIPLSARGADGRSLAVVANVHEYGAVLRSALSKQRMAALAIALKKSGMPPKFKGGGFGLAAAVIPARPFMNPIFEQYGGRRGANRMMARVAQGMGGLLGVLSHPDLKGRSAATIPFRLMGGPAGGSGAFVGQLSKSYARRYAAGSRARRGKSKGSLGSVLAKRFGLTVSKRSKSRASGAKALSQKPRGAARRASSPRGRVSRRQHSSHVKAFRNVQKSQLKAQSGRRHDAHVKAFMKHNTHGPKQQRKKASSA